MNIIFIYQMIWGGKMKRFLISALLITSVFSIGSFNVPTVNTQAYAESYTWSQVSNYGQTEWVLYYGGKQVYGWQYVNGIWYYINYSDGYMAHDTFINGYYVNSDGAWTYDIPYEIQRVKSVIPNSSWIDTLGNHGETITILKNQNLKELYKYGWNAPDVNGSLVMFGEGGEHFVAADGTVYKTAHQAEENLIQYDNDHNVVKVYPYTAK